MGGKGPLGGALRLCDEWPEEEDDLTGLPVLVIGGCSGTGFFQDSMRRMDKWESGKETDDIFQLWPPLRARRDEILS